jgi:hypothetical protein
MRIELYLCYLFCFEIIKRNLNKSGKGTTKFILAYVCVCVCVCIDLRNPIQKIELMMIVIVIVIAIVLQL